jgi:hypothetical protein
MELENPVGAEWVRSSRVRVTIGLALGAAILVDGLLEQLLGGNCVLINHIVTCNPAFHSVGWLFLIVLGGALLAAGLIAFSQARSFGRRLPYVISLGPDGIVATFRSLTSDGLTTVSRRMRFATIDDVKPPRLSWRDQGGRHWSVGSGDRTPAAAYGKFDPTLRADGFHPPQTDRDREIGAGEPYDVIHLSQDNYVKVLESWKKWKGQKVTE